MYIIGITGKAGSGKDTAANMAVEFLKTHNIDARRVALADPLKRICLDIFGFGAGATEEMFIGTQADKNKDIPKIPGWTGRKILQHIGTEGFRHIYPDIWVEYAINHAKWLEKMRVDAVFISDVRFVNEAELLKKAGGKVLRIAHPALDNAVNEGITNHASEMEGTSIDADYVINNDGTLSDFNIKVKSLLCQLFSLPST